jgi:hypothetical protein
MTGMWEEPGVMSDSYVERLRKETKDLCRRGKDLNLRPVHSTRTCGVCMRKWKRRAKSDTVKHLYVPATRIEFLLSCLPTPDFK